VLKLEATPTDVAGPARTVGPAAGTDGQERVNLGRREVGDRPRLALGLDRCTLGLLVGVQSGFVDGVALCCGGLLRVYVYEAPISPLILGGFVDRGFGGLRTGVSPPVYETPCFQAGFRGFVDVDTGDSPTRTVGDDEHPARPAALFAQRNGLPLAPPGLGQ